MAKEKITITKITNKFILPKQPTSAAMDTAVAQLGLFFDEELQIENYVQDCINMTVFRDKINADQDWDVSTWPTLHTGAEHFYYKQATFGTRYITVLIPFPPPSTAASDTPVNPYSFVTLIAPSGSRYTEFQHTLSNGITTSISLGLAFAGVMTGALTSVENSLSEIGLGIISKLGLVESEIEIGFADVSMISSAVALPLLLAGCLVMGILWGIQKSIQYSIEIDNNTDYDLTIPFPYLVNDNTEYEKKNLVIPKREPAGTPIPGVPGGISDQGSVNQFNFVSSVASTLHGVGIGTQVQINGQNLDFRFEKPLIGDLSMKATIDSATAEDYYNTNMGYDDKPEITLNMGAIVFKVAATQRSRSDSDQNWFIKGSFTQT
jgi:hypothetical protein